NTVIASPEMLGVASDFHDRRERFVYAECACRSAAFFKAAAAVYADPFWSARAADPARCQQGDDELTTDAIIRDPVVRRLVDHIRAAGTLRVTVSPTLTVEAVPVVEGNTIVLRDAIATAGFAEPVRFACGVNLPELVRIATASADVSSMIQSYHSRL